MARRNPYLRALPPAFLLLLFLLHPAAAQAADPVTVDVGVVYASNEGSTVDPALGTIRGKLRSMFNYTSFRMLDRMRRTLGVGETRDFELPGSRAMRATPLSVQGNKVRLSIQITEGPKKLLTTTLGLSRGGMVLVGGPTHQSGVLIFAISAE